MRQGGETPRGRQATTWNFTHVVGGLPTAGLTRYPRGNGWQPCFTPRTPLGGGFFDPKLVGRTTIPPHACHVGHLVRWTGARARGRRAITDSALSRKSARPVESRVSAMRVRCVMTSPRVARRTVFALNFATEDGNPLSSLWINPTEDRTLLRPASALERKLVQHTAVSMRPARLSAAAMLLRRISAAPKKTSGAAAAI